MSAQMMDGEEPMPSEVSFLLKDPVDFECVTRCCMTGEEGMDTALTHMMTVVMKVRWWEPINDTMTAMRSHQLSNLTLFIL